MDKFKMVEAICKAENREGWRKVTALINLDVINVIKRKGQMKSKESYTVLTFEVDQPAPLRAASLATASQLYL